MAMPMLMMERIRLGWRMLFSIGSTCGEEGGRLRWGERVQRRAWRRSRRKEEEKKKSSRPRQRSALRQKKVRGHRTYKADGLKGKDGVAKKDGVVGHARPRHRLGRQEARRRAVVLHGQKDGKEKHT